MASDDEIEEGPPDPLSIDAAPTKDFFISMLVRDIELIPAIADLVDNSLDGARNLRSEECYDGLEVDLIVTPDKFVIEDNCGGIELKTAKEYAFRFGRPEGFPPVDRSIGQFGVGMKRALFKLGSEFSVLSTARRSRFSMTVNVPAWREQDDWTFRFDEPPEQFEEPVPEEERGTKVEVPVLHSAVSTDFEEGQTLAELRTDLARRHQLSIAKGLKISINGDPLEPEPIHFAVSSEIRPAQTRLDHDGVAVVIQSGIAESDGQAGGWYVFCNDRLILGADQSAVTGWGWRSGSMQVPKFHNQYARFRGYAFFEAEDSSKLPWTTTKTGVDTEDPAFRQARREMLVLGRPVLDFLNQLAEERANEEEGPLTLAVEEAEQEAAPFDEIDYEEIFTAPERESSEEGTRYSAVHYVRSIEQLDDMKELLGASSNKQVGEKTFDLYYDEAFGESGR